MIIRDLERIVLLDPYLNGCDQLKVLSGYVTATMVNRHLHATRQMVPSNGGRKPPDVDVVFGMAESSGVPTSDHNSFVRMQTETYPDRFSCSYLVDRPAVHAKVYVWLRDGKPCRAYVGSANYTQSGFVFETDRMEAMEECDPQIAYEVFESSYRRSIECTHESVEEQITLRREERVSEPVGDSVRLSFVIERGSRQGQTPLAAGINWAFRLNETPRNFNEAYLRVQREIATSDFFPETGVHFTVITDDGHMMICRVAQDGRKAIETPESNAILGRYIRDRMGITERRRLTGNDFRKYGRTDVTMTRFDNETYFMDFGITD